MPKISPLKIIFKEPSNSKCVFQRLSYNTIRLELNGLKDDTRAFIVFIDPINKLPVAGVIDQDFIRFYGSNIDIDFGEGRKSRFHDLAFKDSEQIVSLMSKKKNLFPRPISNLGEMRVRTPSIDYLSFEPNFATDVVFLQCYKPNPKRVELAMERFFK